MVQVNDVELGVGSRARPRLHGRVAESRDYQEWRVSDFFGNYAGIADRSGIGVTSSRSHLSHLESMGIKCGAESQGGLGDRGHEEGSPRHVFESKQVVSAILGARIAAIASLDPSGGV